MPERLIELHGQLQSCLRHFDPLINIFCEEKTLGGTAMPCVCTQLMCGHSEFGVLERFPSCINELVFRRSAWTVNNLDCRSARVASTPCCCSQGSLQSVALQALRLQRLRTVGVLTAKELDILRWASNTAWKTPRSTLTWQEYSEASQLETLVRVLPACVCLLVLL
jgi:hypothetical protein